MDIVAARELGILRWEDPPPERRGGRPSNRFPAELVALDLRRNPGRWAVVEEAPNRLSLASQIRDGLYPAFRPAGSFEAVSRSLEGVVVTYARYVGVDDRTVPPGCDR